MNGKSAIFTPLYLVNPFGKNEKSSDLDSGRRPELKSDELRISNRWGYRAKLTFVFETAETNGAVIGGATPANGEYLKPKLVGRIA